MEKSNSKRVKIRLKIPLILTITRGFSGLLIYLLLTNGFFAIGFLSYTVFLFSDFLDGYLARRWKTESRLGENLEPICDSLFLAGPIIFFIQRGTFSAWIFIFLGIILLINHLIWFSKVNNKIKEAIALFGFLSFVIVTFIVSYQALRLVFDVILTTFFLLIFSLVAILIQKQRLKDRIFMPIKELFGTNND